jgi:uncharacterized protein YfbU (UPF0304 family)
MIIKGYIMKKPNAAKLYTAVQKEQELIEKNRAEEKENIENLQKIAEERGYQYSIKELKEELSHLSEEEIASLINPGVGPRHHILAR